MSIQDSKMRTRARRTLRVRSKVKGTAERPRLTVFRSNRAMWAQVIDDRTGHTLVSASTLNVSEKGLSKTDQATKVGLILAERAKAAGVEHVVFDRGPYLYHGRVKALADGAREGGLDF
jgi:large subunit ribosomal protein L18